MSAGNVMVVPRDGMDEAEIIAAIRAVRGPDDSYSLSTAGPRLAFLMPVELARKIGRGPAEDAPSDTGAQDAEEQPADDGPVDSSAPAKTARARK
jgi:hypothetical protein